MKPCIYCQRPTAAIFQVTGYDLPDLSGCSRACILMWLATRTVVLHEVGHAVGLSHTDVLGAVMYPSYSSPIPLHPDDLAGYCAVYGCGVVDTPTPTASPTATPTATATPTPTVVIYRKFVPGVIRD